MEPFDATDPYLLPTTGGTKIYLNNQKFTLGRGLNNSFIIEDIQISRTHCLFEKISGTWCLSDQSSNGTFVNQKKLPSKTPQMLSDGDVIKLNETVEYIFVNKKKDSFDDVDLAAVLDENNFITTDSVIEIDTSDDISCVQSAFIDNTGTNVENIYVSSTSINSSCLPIDSISVPYVNEHTYCQTANTTNIDPHTTDNTNKASTSNINTVENAQSQEKLTAKPQCSKNTMEEFEDELQCIICTELFVKAMTLNCSHSFCKYCIEEWNKKNKKCPICRTKISVITPTIVLDNFIAKVLESASQDVKERRAEIVKEREKQETVPPIIIKGGKVLRTREIAPIEIISSEEDSYNEDDDFDYEDDYDDSNYNGVSGAYYGGYGSCYSCGETGHWANGCPYR